MLGLQAVSTVKAGGQKQCISPAQKIRTELASFSPIKLVWVLCSKAILKRLCSVKSCHWLLDCISAVSSYIYWYDVFTSWWMSSRRFLVLSHPCSHRDPLDPASQTPRQQFAHAELHNDICLTFPPLVIFKLDTVQHCPHTFPSDNKIWQLAGIKGDAFCIAAALLANLETVGVTLNIFGTIAHCLRDFENKLSTIWWFHHSIQLVPAAIVQHDPHWSHWASLAELGLVSRELSHFNVHMGIVLSFYEARMATQSGGPDLSIGVSASMTLVFTGLLLSCVTSRETPCAMLALIPL